MENLFYQLVLKLSELGEAEFKNVFVDSIKIDDIPSYGQMRYRRI